MAYATKTDLTTLSLPSGALTGISDLKIDAALEAASREADGYLNVPFRLPLIAHGSDLKQKVCDMAAMTLMKARGFSPESADAEMFEAGRKAAIKWLEGVAAGKIKPIGITDSSPGNVNAEDASTEQRGPFVVQLSEGGVRTDEFWKGQSTSDATGRVGTPKRRGW